MGSKGRLKNRLSIISSKGVLKKVEYPSNILEAIT